MGFNQQDIEKAGNILIKANLFLIGVFIASVIYGTLK